MGMKPPGPRPAAEEPVGKSEASEGTLTGKTGVGGLFGKEIVV